MASVTPPTNELQAKEIKEQEKGQVKRERGERERRERERERESSNQRRQKGTEKHLHAAIHMYMVYQLILRIFNTEGISKHNYKIIRK